MATDRLILPSDPINPGRSPATRSKTEDGVPKHFQRVILEQPRTVTFRGSVATFRTLGAAATTHNLFTIENQAGSSVLVALRKLNVTTQQTAAVATVPPYLNLYRITTLPTGGTQLTKTSVDSSDPTSSTSVVVRGATASDGGGATAITATAAGAKLASHFTSTLYSTTSGAGVPYRIEVIDPELAADQPFILRAGQAYLLQIQATAAGENPATRHWIATTRWEEYTEF